MDQPYEDQFRLLPNISYFTFEAFERIESTQF